MWLNNLRRMSLCACGLMIAVSSVLPAFAANPSKRNPKKEVLQYCTNREYLTDLDGQRSKLLLNRAVLDALPVIFRKQGEIDKLTAKINGLNNKIASIESISKPSAADFNSDGKVDDKDLDRFSVCQLTGDIKIPGCAKADMDGDGSVNTSDLGWFASYRECYEVNYPVYRDRKTQCGGSSTPPGDAPPVPNVTATPTPAPISSADFCYRDDGTKILCAMCQVGVTCHRDSTSK